MLPEKKKRLQELALMGGGGLILVLALFFLVGYEQARSRDAVRLSVVSQVQSALQHYYLKHSAYPPAVTTPLVIGSGIANCLGDKGFNSYGSTPCTSQPFLTYIPSAPQTNAQDDYLYTPLNAGGGICDSKVACADYSIQFYLETGASNYQRGLHLMRPNGIQ